MIITSNLAVLNGLNKQKKHTSSHKKHLENLSSGLRINKAADDSAGLAISEKMRAQIRGISRASLNTQEGIDLVNVAEGGLGEIHALLQRMRELAVQSSNDTYTKQDRLMLQKEITTLTEQVEHISNSTEYNTIPLLNGLGNRYVSNIDGIENGDTGEVNPSPQRYFSPQPDGSHLGILDMRSSSPNLEPGEYTLELHKFVTNTTGRVGDVWYGTYSFRQASIQNADFSELPAGGYAITSFVEPEVTNFSSGGGITNIIGYSPAMDSTTWPWQMGDRGIHETGNDFRVEVTGVTDNRTVTIYDNADNKIAEQSGLLDSAAANGLMLSTLDDRYGHFEVHSANLINTNDIPSTFDTINSDWKIGLMETSNREIDYSYTPINYVEHSVIDLWGMATVETLEPTYNLSLYFDVIYNYRVSLLDSEDNYIILNEPIYPDSTLTLGRGGYFVPISQNTNITYDTGSTLNTGTMQIIIAGDEEPPEENDGEAEEEITERLDSQFILQVGPNSGDNFYVNIDDMRTNALGISKSSSSEETNVQYLEVDSDVEYVLDISNSLSAANGAIVEIDKAIADVSNVRGRLGTYHRSLDHIINNLENYGVNLQDAQSRIRDLDMAREVTEKTKVSILLQSSLAILIQANQKPENLLKLLEL